MEKDNRITQEEHVHQIRAIGQYFGYPSCCINSFVEGETTVRIENNKTGFLPCNAHSKQIIDKEITIESLIKDRKCKYEFPKQPKKTVNLLKHILEIYEPDRTN